MYFNLRILRLILWAMVRQAGLLSSLLLFKSMYELVFCFLLLSLYLLPRTSQLDLVKYQLLKQ